MSDLIERKDAIDYFVTNIGVVDEDGYAVDDYDERVKIWTERFSGIPSADPERKKGKWISVESQTVNGRCSVCGYESHLYENDVYGEYYCPNCGAEMRGE